MPIGVTQQLSASVLDASGNPLSGRAITWSTSDASKASVSPTGLVTALAVGVATITAACEGRQATSGITVSQPSVASVSVSPGNISLAVGSTQQIVATPRDAAGNAINGKTVSWSATDIVALYGTVSGNTLTVTGRSVATVTVYATVDGISGTALVTIGSTASAAVATVSMSVGSLTLDIGQTTTVTATPRDAAGNAIAGKTVAWQTSDASVVGGSVNLNSADLQAVGAGAAIVTATVDGKVGQMSVTVRTSAPKPVATVTISPSSYSLAIGATVQLVATLRDANGIALTGRAVTWSTSNSAVASGTATGNVAAIQGVSSGSATITASSEGVRGTSIITVVQPSGGGVVLLTCSGLAGGSVYGQDGVFLGRLTSAFDSQSINNTFGQYGSQFSSTSMYNQFSQYGSQFAANSAYNPFASTPPILLVSGGAVYVTKNTFKLPRVDPDYLRGCTFF